MNGPEEQPDALSPAERRLGEHLQLLRTDPPAPPAPLVARILRVARWQRAVRGPLVAVGALAGAVLDGLRSLLASRARRS